MHDPMVVAWEVPFPLPRRLKWRDARPGAKRWTLGRMRRTNPENLGEPVYHWWRPTGWQPRLAGRAFGLHHFITVWHVEPGGRDAFEVCKHNSRWKWHVHHWRLQVIPLQRIRARLFDRCAMCGRKGRPNVSHQWDGKRLGWWKFRSREGLYHSECSALGHTRITVDTDEVLIRYLMSALAVTSGEDEAIVLARLTDPKNRSLEFREAYRLTNVVGFERDEDYNLVKKA